MIQFSKSETTDYYHKTKILIYHVFLSIFVDVVILNKSSRIKRERCTIVHIHKQKKVHNRFLAKIFRGSFPFYQQYRYKTDCCTLTSSHQRSSLKSTR